MDVLANPNQKSTILFSSIYNSLMKHIRNSFFSNYETHLFEPQQFDGSNKIIHFLKLISLQKGKNLPKNNESKSFELFVLIKSIFLFIWFLVFTIDLMGTLLSIYTIPSFFLHPNFFNKNQSSEHTPIIFIIIGFTTLIINILSYWRWGIFIQRDNLKSKIFRIIWISLFFSVYLLGILFFILLILEFIKEPYFLEVYLKIRWDIIFFFLIFNFVFFIPTLNILFTVGFDFLSEIIKLLKIGVSFFLKISEFDNIERSEILLEEDIPFIKDSNFYFKIMDLGINKIKLIKEVTETNREDIDKRITPFVFIFSFFALISNTPTITNIIENILSNAKKIFIIESSSEAISGFDHLSGFINFAFIFLILFFFMIVLGEYAIRLKIYGTLITSCNIAITKISSIEDNYKKKPRNFFLKFIKLIKLLHN